MGSCFGTKSKPKEEEIKPQQVSRIIKSELICYSRKLNSLFFNDIQESRKSPYKSNPDYDADNIKGALLRANEHKGFVGAKRQSSDDWPRTKADYFLFKEFLASKKAKDPKFSAMKDLADERVKLIDKIAAGRGLPLTEDNNKEGGDNMSGEVEGEVQIKKKNTIKDSGVEGEHKFNGKTASQYKKDVSEFGIPEFYAYEKIQNKNEDVEGNLANLKKKHGVSDSLNNNKI